MLYFYFYASDASLTEVSDDSDSGPSDMVSSDTSNALACTGAEVAAWCTLLLSLALALALLALVNGSERLMRLRVLLFAD